MVQEINTLSDSRKPVRRVDCVVKTLPYNLVQLGVATAVFWVMSARVERRSRTDLRDNDTEKETRAGSEPESKEVRARVNVVKAAVPLLPLALLFLTARFVDWNDPNRSYQAIAVPQSWLVDEAKDLSGLELGPARQKRADELFDARLIGVAMVIGAAAAALTGLPTAAGRRELAGSAAFFEGAGYAFKEIVAIIVVANGFAEGIKLLGIGALFGRFVAVVPGLLIPASGLLTMGFAFVSGSGFSAMQSLFGVIAGPAAAIGLDLVRVGSIASLAAAAGRTMSPAAAVNLMCATHRHGDDRPGQTSRAAPAGRRRGRDSPGDVGVPAPLISFPSTGRAWRFPGDRVLRPCSRQTRRSCPGIAWEPRRDRACRRRSCRPS